MSFSSFKEAERPPTIIFNGNVYLSAGNTTDLAIASKMAKEVDDLLEVGKIESIDSRPTENYQSNDPVLINYSIYVSDSIPDFIFVLYEGEFLSYKIETLN